jgi:hypothetical protein
MPQALDFDVGESFNWACESYVVVRQEDDNIVVHKTVGRTGQVIPDEKRFEENFNPYANVKRVLPKTKTES